MKLTRLCFVGMFVALGIASTALADWGTAAFATAHAEAPNRTPQTIIDIDDNFQPESEVDAVAINVGTFAAGLAHVKTGDLGVTVNLITNGTSFSGPPQNQGRIAATAEAIAQWKDTFVFSVPNKPDGTQYAVDFTITAHGSLDVNATLSPPHPIPGQVGFTGAYSGASVSATAQFFDFSAHPGDPGFGGVVLARGSHQINTFTGEDSFDPFPSDSTGHWVLTTGEINTYLFQLRLSATTLAALQPEGTESSALGDFFGSLHWGGIQSVRDAVTGELITDWTITAESGFDYSKSYEEQVPEPSSLGLIVALIGTSLARRRRHRGGRG